MGQINLKDFMGRLSWVPAVLIMIFIFVFSSKPAVVSQENSHFFSYNILNVYETITKEQIEEHRLEETLNTIDFYVRKTAHLMEYAALSFWIGIHLYKRGFKKSTLRLWSVVIGSFYAVTDEIHQLFVPGRSGQLRDVVIDTTGAFIGVLALSLLLFMLERYKRIRRNKNL